MKIKLCSRAVIEFEVKNRIRNLERDESVEFKITPCEVLDNTFDLEIKFAKLNNKVRREKDSEIKADKFFDRMIKMTKLELRRQIEKMYNEINDLNLQKSVEEKIE